MVYNFRLLIITILFVTGMHSVKAFNGIISAPMQIVSITSFGTDTVIAAGGYKYNPVSGWPGDYSYLLRSIDGGITWKVIYRLHSNAQFHSVYALNNSTGFAVADSGLMYKTIDAGSSWFRVALPSGINLYNIEFTDSLTGYATGSQERYLKTIDGGYTWTQKAIGASYNGLYDITWASATRGFICGERFYTTTNGGNSWNIGSNFSGFIKTKMHFKNTQEGFAAPFSGGIGKTTNAGLSWTVDTTANIIDLHEFDNAHFIGVKDSSVYETVDSGNTWILKYTLPVGDAEAIHFSSAMKGWIGCANEIYSTTDGGATWMASGYQHAGTADVIAFDSLTLYSYSAIWQDLLYQTFDGGGSWRHHVTPSGLNISSLDFVSPAVGFGAGPGGLYSTLDSGFTWTLINATPIEDVKAFNQLNLIAYDGINGNHVYTSTNGGVTWNLLQPVYNNPSIKKLDANVGFAVTYPNTLYRTIDGGATWQVMNSNFTMSTWDMLDSLNGISVLSTNSDVYKTTDGGITWNYLSTNSNLVNIKMIDLQTVCSIGLGSYFYLSMDSGVTFNIAENEITPYLRNLTKSPTGEVIFYGDLITGNFINGFPLCATKALYDRPYAGIFESDTEHLINQSLNAQQFQWYDNGNFITGNTDYDFTSSDTGSHAISLMASDGNCNADYSNSIYVHPFGSVWLQRTGINYRNLVKSANFQIGNFGYRCNGSLNVSSTDSCFRINLKTLTWEPVANLPASPRYGNTGFAIGGYGYEVSYDGTLNQNQLWRYDASNDTWIQKALFPGNARIGSSSFVLNNKAYVICGYKVVASTAIYNNECWEYDPANDTWTQRTSMPGLERIRGAAFAVNGFGYYGGGWQVTNLFDYYKYDPINDSWSVIPSIPGNPNVYLPQTFVRDNDGYLLAGNNPSFVYKYNSISNSWDSAVMIINQQILDGVCFINGDSVLSCHSSNQINAYPDIWYMRFAPSSIPVSTQQNASAEKMIDVNVYPNPAKDQITITSGNLKMNAIEIVNPLGGILIREKINRNMFIQNLSGFNNGIYMVRCFTKKGIVNKRIVITGRQ